MFAIGWRFLRYVLGLLTFVGVGLILLAVDFSPTELPSTSLGTLEARTYYMTLRELADTPTGASTEIVLSPQETSYLLEQYSPEQSRYGFEAHDVHLEASGSRIRLRTVLKAPAGMYVLVTYEGIIEVEGDRWTFHPESVVLGSLPVSWLVPSTWPVNVPTRFADGSIEVTQARLNGQGLKAQVINHGLQLDLSMGLLNQFR